MNHETWHYEHSDHECTKCRTQKGAFELDYFLGIDNGRDAEKYVCTNAECDFEQIHYVDDLVVNPDGSVQSHPNDVGKKVTLANGQTRILKQDGKGLYVLYGGLKNYVYFMETYQKYAMTGEWDHTS